MEGGLNIPFAPHFFMGHTSQGFVALQVLVLFNRGKSVTRCHTDCDARPDMTTTMRTVFMAVFNVVSKYTFSTETVWCASLAIGKGLRLASCLDQ